MISHSNKEKRYFAGANTTKGFVSYYDEIFKPCSSIYVIKGGSGTGKSRLMREIADRAESVGNDVEYFYCSFDPLSLDGIIINRSLAVIDGTAPHVYEPSLPGIKENLIDLGVFWNANKLREHSEEIISFINDKKHCFDMAYSYLSSVGALDTARRKILDKYIDRDKIYSVAAKTVSDIKPQKSGNSGVRIISALGRSGRVKFDTYDQTDSQSITVRDDLGEGHLYLEAIKTEAERFGVPVTVSYDPLYAGRMNALMIGDSASVFVEEKKDGLPAYVEKGEKKEVEEIDAQTEVLLGKAEKWLERASKIHFEIEKFYVSAMDFDKKEEFTRGFINSLQM